MRLANPAAGLALFGFLLGPAMASPTPEGNLTPEIANALSEWTSCTVPKIKAKIQLPHSAASIVDEAFAVCSVKDNAFAKVWMEHYGQDSADQVQNFRTKTREAYIEVINSARNRTPQKSAAGAWGVCVGSHIPEPLPVGVRSEVVADTAMAACSSEFEAIRAEKIKNFGAELAENAVQQLRVETRKKAIEVIERRRIGK